MKKKLLLITLMVALFVCLLLVSVSAAELTNYCDVKITLTTGEQITAYCKIDTNDSSLQRDTVYKAPDTTSETISWADIKIFDASNANVVGGVNPIEVRGVNCNKIAKNVTEFYFPDTTTKVLNTTFTTEWVSLEKVYIPKSVRTIDNDSFKGSAVKEVIIEEGSQLETIGASAFQGCNKLSKINLQEGLLSIGRNGFYQTALCGTVKLPNSVNYLAPGALLSTEIETLILGDGPLTIGYNFAGTYNTTNNAYLKNVYIPANTAFEPDGTTQMIFFKCTNPVNFYIVGSEEECASLVTTLKAQSKGMYLTFIEESEATESTGAGYGIMHTCYNRCDAFYDKNHSMGDPVFNFANVSEKIIYTSVCERCQNEENVKELAPIIEGLGYSARINGDRICVGYKLNNDSINAYNEATGITLTFGVVAISPINDDELKPLYVENGEVKPLDYTISAALDGDFASFDFIISGFNDSYYSKELVMCAYVFDGESIKYICYDENATDGIKLTVGDIAGTITFDKVATE